MHTEAGHPPDIDDWEGRLAAMATGVRYRRPEKRRPRTPAPLPASATTPMPASVEEDLLTLLAEPCPCDRCPMRHACATEQMACQRYAMFLHGRNADAWHFAACTPSQELFQALGMLEP